METTHTLFSLYWYGLKMKYDWCINKSMIHLKWDQLLNSTKQVKQWKQNVKKLYCNKLLNEMVIFMQINNYIINIKGNQWKTINISFTIAWITRGVSFGVSTIKTRLLIIYYLNKFECSEWQRIYVNQLVQQKMSA